MRALGSDGLGGIPATSPVSASVSLLSNGRNNSTYLKEDHPRSHAFGPGLAKWQRAQPHKHFPVILGSDASNTRHRCHQSHFRDRRGAVTSPWRWLSWPTAAGGPATPTAPCLSPWGTEIWGRAAHSTQWLSKGSKASDFLIESSFCKEQNRVKTLPRTKLAANIPGARHPRFSLFIF